MCIWQQTYYACGHLKGQTIIKACSEMKRKPWGECSGIRQFAKILRTSSKCGRCQGGGWAD
jgi:hypothetical protein